MMFDSHTHTEFSADSEMLASEALEAAERLGLGLVFTEHLDLEAAPIEFTFDPEAYWKKYLPLRGENLRLGIEVGMKAGTLEGSREFVARVPFDQVIGSIHFLDDLDIYYPDFFEDKEKEEAYRKYFRAMVDNLYSHDFIDILAHIDYICRTAPYDNPELDYGSFKEEIDTVLKAVIETETVLELNTRRFGDKLAVKELVPIYSRYRELGGKYVTVGSDAHNKETIGAHFYQARLFVSDMDLQPVTFCKRRMELCD
ncbi:MAG: histidinol-phosphatase HisJ family protein [Selenomonas sp.]|nr:histidinol-phosphatase HisJ family protein [Selenomonas sp.]